MKTQFQESQKFRQKWLWALLIGSFLFSMFMLAIPYFQGTTIENVSDLYISAAISLAIFTLVFLLFYFLELKTKITTEGIEMSLFCIVKKKITWQEIESAQIIDYGFLGGWGIRMWTKYGTVYNVAGSKGLHILLKNGNQFLIGSQRTEELGKVLNQLKN